MVSSSGLAWQGTVRALARSLRQFRRTLPPLADMTRDNEVSIAKAALGHLKLRPRFTPGVAAYQVYHRPLGWLKRVAATGAINAWRGAIARRKLRQRVLHGPPILVSPSCPGSTLTVDLLTGRRFGPESIVVAHSFSRAAKHPCEFHFYDDGTLAKSEADAIRLWFPGAHVHHRSEIEIRLARQLPRERFPVLHALREVFVLIKKLTDLAAGTGGWRIYLDSDMLFFREPTSLLRHVTDQKPCHLVDVMTCYGAPVKFLSDLAGREVHPRVNTGLYFRNVDTIDWDFLEDAARLFLNRFGYSYFLEQALAALLFARECAVPLDPDYLVLPDPGECKHPTRALHHYVNQSRWAFYVNGWHGLP